MWLWAGTHKALSLGWSTGGASFIGSALGVPKPWIAALVPVAEIALGLMAMWPRLGKATAAGGFILHSMIVVTLLAANWNSAVWPWNVGLALASLLLFTERVGKLQNRRVVRGAALAFFIYPALFYLGLGDAYLSHNLYTSNTAEAAVCTPGTALCLPAPFSTWTALNVPLPPEPRLYRQWFQMTCTPGTVLRITGPRTRLTDPPSVTHDPCITSVRAEDPAGPQRTEKSRVMPRS